MSALIGFYIFFLFLALGYVVINAFHLINFRLSFRGDYSLTLLSFYLITVVSLIVGSIFFAIITYNF